MPEKVAIVTGANAGLGFELTRLLVSSKFKVIMACRSLERGENALKKIAVGPDELQPLLMQLDLADLRSVRDFAQKFKETFPTLSLLVNNAGLSMDFNCKERYTTKDGFDLIIGTNHLGHFLLTNLLLDTLKSTAAEMDEARIVNVTSMLHQYESNKRPFNDLKPMDFDDLMMENDEHYFGKQAYKNSKAMNILFTKKLSRMLQGTNVTATCICPGFVPTSEFMRNASGGTICCLRCFIPCLACCGVTRTLSTASGHMLDLCVNPELKGVTGVWYTDGRQMETSTETRDEGNQDKLWEWSCQKVEL